MDKTQESCRTFVEMPASSSLAPGGVGTVTSTVVMKHVIQAAQNSTK